MTTEMIMTILLIGALGTTAGVLIIPFLRDRNNEVKGPVREKHKAYISIFSNDIAVDGKHVLDMNNEIGENGEQIIGVWSGLHIFEGVFEAKDMIGARVVTLKTRKLKFGINFEPNCTYRLALYLFSPEERRKYHKGNVGEDVFVLPVTVKGRKAEAYIICYKEEEFI